MVGAAYKISARCADFPRPKSQYERFEEPAQEGVPFDYDAQPERFYFTVESVGNHEPDQIVQQSIQVMQKKLAQCLKELTEDSSGMNGGGDYAPQSPGYNPPNGGGAAWQDQGYNGGAVTPGYQGSTTPYATTPYGATPYGQSGSADSRSNGAW